MDEMIDMGEIQPSDTPLPEGGATMHQDMSKLGMKVPMDPGMSTDPSSGGGIPKTMDALKTLGAGSPYMNNNM